MENTLKKEFEYYLENQDQMIKDFNGKVIVIKDRKVIGIFDDQVTAVMETQKAHKLGSFLVQKVEPGSSAYTQTFHSRVAFC